MTEQNLDSLIIFSQVTIVEIILRFTNKNIRSEVVSNWFPNYVKVQSLFLTIKDFENDCRNFLNHFNEGLGEKMSVCSFKLLSCRVEGRILVKPLGLNDFWTDFNLGTCSISLYYVFQEDQVSIFHPSVHVSCVCIGN